MKRLSGRIFALLLAALLILTMCGISALAEDANISGATPVDDGHKAECALSEQHKAPEECKTEEQLYEVMNRNAFGDGRASSSQTENRPNAFVPVKLQVSVKRADGALTDAAVTQGKKESLELGLLLENDQGETCTLDAGEISDKQISVKVEVIPTDDGDAVVILEDPYISEAGVIAFQNDKAIDTASLNGTYIVQITVDASLVYSGEAFSDSVTKSYTLTVVPSFTNLKLQIPEQVLLESDTDTIIVPVAVKATDTNGTQVDVTASAEIQLSGGENADQTLFELSRDKYALSLDAAKVSEAAENNGKIEIVASYGSLRSTAILKLADEDYIAVLNDSQGFETIEAAISAASDGDTVTIKNGTHQLSNTLHTYKQITLQGESRDETILDATNVPEKAWGVLVNSSNTTIKNLTIKSDKETGANNLLKISAELSNPKVDRLTDVAVQNVTLTGGKGLDIYNSDVTIDGASISDSAGASIAVTNGANVTIKNTTAANAAWKADIGVMYLDGDAPCKIDAGTGNTFNDGVFYHEQAGADAFSTVPAGFKKTVQNGVSLYIKETNALPFTRISGGKEYAYATLPEAVKTAENGDVIEVAAGTHVLNETIVPKVEYLTIRGAQGETKPLIQGASELNGMFSVTSGRHLEVENVGFALGKTGGYNFYYSHKGTVVEVNNCDFTLMDGCVYGGNLFMNEGVANAATLKFTNNTVTGPYRVMFAGIGNNSVVSGNVIDTLTDRIGTNRVSVVSVSADADNEKIEINSNTFKNANRIVAVDNSPLMKADAIEIKNNKFINVRYAFELDPTTNKDCGQYNLSRNYYSLDGSDKGTPLLVEDASSSEGTHFDSARDYQGSQVTVYPYYVDEAMTQLVEAPVSIDSQQFTTIASALAAAKDGDVILVSEGEYAEENLLIEKKVTLKAKDPDKRPLIKSNGRSITVSADVTIDSVDFESAVDTFAVDKRGVIAAQTKGANLVLHNSKIHTTGVSDAIITGVSNNGSEHNRINLELENVEINADRGGAYGVTVKSSESTVSIKNSEIHTDAAGTSFAVGISASNVRLTVTNSKVTSNLYHAIRLFFSNNTLVVDHSEVSGYGAITVGMPAENTSVTVQNGSVITGIENPDGFEYAAIADEYIPGEGSRNSRMNLTITDSTVQTVDSDVPEKGVGVNQNAIAIAGTDPTLTIHNSKILVGEGAALFLDCKPLKPMDLTNNYWGTAKLDEALFAQRLEPNVGIYGQMPPSWFDATPYYTTSAMSSSASSIDAFKTFTIDKSQATLLKGETLDLNVVIQMIDNTDGTVVWSSSDTSVAAIGSPVQSGNSSKVTLTAKTAGKAKITASAGGKTVQCVVIVTDTAIAPSGITLNSFADMNLTTGASDTRVVTVLPVNATGYTLSTSMTNSSVASLHFDGNKLTVTALKTGTAVATIKVDGTEYSASFKVIVTGPDKMVPLLQRRSPAAGAQNVSASAMVELVFDEDIQVVEGAQITLKEQGKTDTVSTSVKVINGSKLRITPLTALANGKTYTIHIPGDTISDLSGNWITDAIEWSFTTASSKLELDTLTINDNGNIFDAIKVNDSSYKAVVSSAISRENITASSSNVKRVDVSETVWNSNGTGIVRITVIAQNDATKVYTLALTKFSIITELKVTEPDGKVKVESNHDGATVAPPPRELSTAGITVSGLSGATDVESLLPSDLTEAKPVEQNAKISLEVQKTDVPSGTTALSETDIRTAADPEVQLPIVNQLIAETADDAAIAAVIDISLTKSTLKDGEIHTTKEVPTAENPLKITYQLPEEARGKASYSVIHLKSDGSVEILSAKLIDNRTAIYFEVDNFSPFVVAYSKTPMPVTSVGGDSGDSGDSGKNHSQISYEFWEKVKKEIRNADDGDIVKANARNVQNVPASVLRTLEGRDVTLVISYKGGTIVIYGGNMLPIPGNKLYYRFDDLAELYEDIDPSAPEREIPHNPVTGGYIEGITVPTVVIEPQTQVQLPNVPNVPNTTDLAEKPSVVPEKGDTVAPAVPGQTATQPKDRAQVSNIWILVLCIVSAVLAAAAITFGIYQYRHRED